MKSPFIIDKAKYCCGIKAQRQKFALRWYRLNHLPLGNNLKNPTAHARNSAECYINEIWQKLKILPSNVSLDGYGDVCIEWEHVSLCLDPYKSYFDVLHIGETFVKVFDINTILKELK